MASIPYKVVKRTVYVQDEKKVIYSPRISPAGKVTTKSMAAQIAVESTISDNEAKRFVDGFTMIIRQALSNGIQIKLDKLGILTPTFNAKAVDEREDAIQNTVLRKTVIYRPSVTMNKKIQTASFRKINLNLSHV